CPSRPWSRRRHPGERPRVARHGGPRRRRGAHVSSVAARRSQRATWAAMTVPRRGARRVEDPDPRAAEATSRR
ncbi:MAG: hypothetical protein AVDCRST_MAG49-2883, partial [uncultured Thermomicrobiales bacterium]